MPIKNSLLSVVRELPPGDQISWDRVIAALPTNGFDQEREFLDQLKLLAVNHRQLRVQLKSVRGFSRNRKLEIEALSQRIDEINRHLAHLSEQISHTEFDRQCLRQENEQLTSRLTKALQHAEELSTELARRDQRIRHLEQLLDLSLRRNQNSK